MYTEKSSDFNIVKNAVVFFSAFVFLIFSLVIKKHFPTIKYFPHFELFLLYTHFCKAKTNHSVFFIFGLIADILQIVPLGTSSFVWLINLFLTKFFAKKFILQKNTFILFDFFCILFYYFLLKDKYFYQYFYQLLIDIVFYLPFIKYYQYANKK
ncbi:MAG: hypothetical protein Ta2D_08760 [Rickettsiales bacterium]|nr:MAG: hypothetical protein Ta2D_08760 [Rickettsiales bacterium]